MRYFPAFITIYALFLSGCGGDDSIYARKKAIDPLGWAYSDAVVFDFGIQDTSKIYALQLDMRHSTEYPYQNIYFDISTRFPSGRQLNQQISSDLAEKTGKWYGDCSGEGCEVAINLQEKAKFTEKGTHRITISQHTRDSALAGVEYLKLSLYEKEPGRRVE